MVIDPCCIETGIEAGSRLGKGWNKRLWNSEVLARFIEA
jgi:hypothetical protein